MSQRANVARPSSQNPRIKIPDVVRNDAAFQGLVMNHSLPPSAISPSGGDALSVSRLVLLASLAALGALATNIMLPAFPSIATDLNVGARQLSWTLSSFFIVFAIGQLFVGPLSDAFGRVPFVMGGLAVFILGSLICAVAPSFEALIAGRAIQALGACAASVLARALARDLYQGPALTRALALVMIAMAAAPGFSPALGTIVTHLLGWRGVFVFTALAAAAILLHYKITQGETLPRPLRRAARPFATLHGYASLAADPRFILPALSVSLVIGCLYSFFGAAPALLMVGFGFSGTQMSVFFAATVFVVFGSGLITSPLARRWGAANVGLAGLLIALAGGVWLLGQASTSTPISFMAAVTLFLAGMGLINPTATAIALEPFGDRAGMASALLGFLQMGCAAVGTALIGALPLSPALAYCWVIFGGVSLAVLAFIPVTRTTNP